MFEVIDDIQDMKEKRDAVILPRVRGETELKNLSFAYNEEIPVLENMSLKIQPGQTVALVGTTGL